MCGLTAILDPTGARRLDAIGPMTDSLQHRGPDAEGAWADQVCALGHRRLSIIDLSEAGRQPLSNEDGSVWIVFNGEVYNFQALRAELETLGHEFHSHTDTETIVHAYEQWGTACARRLRGMFAFVIWDQKARRLFAARDRVGKKPLFYSEQSGLLLFASELQGILAHPAVPREPDLAAIDAYLTWGYIPAPQTGFIGISKLDPGCWMTVDPGSSGPRVNIEQYYSLEYGPKLQISEAEASEALRDKLTEAVRLRMISDVPLGAFLSGGVDSSIIVGLMAGLSSQPVKTFSIGFEEAEFSEVTHARRVAERFATDHHEHIVRPDALAILPMLVRHYGEPYADSSAVPTYYVSQLTRRDVTVALNGDGGDESFAGYERYLGNRIADRVQRFPGSRQAAGILSCVLPDSLNPKSRLRQVRRFLTQAHRPMAERYSNWMGFFREDAKEKLYTGSLRERLNGARPLDWLKRLFETTGSLDPADAAMSVDVRSYLPFDLLVKVDITSMANSLEARSPLLDQEVMEFAARLPSNFKLKGSNSKHILKSTFSDLLPPENVNRRKMGFGVPVGAWFRGPMRDLLRDCTLSAHSLGRGYFQEREVSRLVTEHLEGRADHAYALWNLVMLEMWHREMVDRPIVAGG